jgi:hypothetical protein
MTSKPPERLEGESALWYGRFCDYYLPMEPTERSVDGAYRKSIVPGRKAGARASTPWYRASQKYNWIERAAAWDQIQRDQLLDDLVQERREDHRRRIEVLKATRARVLEALAALDVSEAKWSQIIQGVVAINGELRKEYGADSAPAEIPVASIRPSDLDGLTDEQLDAVEAAARILEDSTNSQNNKKSKSSNLINFEKKQATG